MSARVYPGRVGVPPAGFRILRNPSRRHCQTSPARAVGEVCAGRINRRAGRPPYPRLVALVILIFAIFSHSQAAQEDTFSPVVSYQYPDTLAEPGTPIISPVVSYQYYEWPGDESLTFQHSPNVSYYFSGGVILHYLGSVRTIGGMSITGATVTLLRYGTVFWQGVSDGNGNYSAPTLPAANYTLRVSKTGYQTLITNIAGMAGGNGNLQVILAPELPANPTVSVNRNPAPSALGTTAPGSSFKGYSFSNNAFANDVVLDPERMTVVLTHGWLSNPGVWARELAERICLSLPPAQRPNVVVWDWTTAAGGGVLSIVGKIDVAATEGRRLGVALQAAVGADYRRHLHFIGHSLGTIVNRYACDYVHASFPENRESLNSPNSWTAAQTTPHVTLLDEAAIASAVGTSVVTSTLVSAGLSGGAGAAVGAVTAALTNWKSPLPKEARWIDNYISAVGGQHDKAVNVCLIHAAETTLNPITAHGYSHEWYRWSAAPGIAFPPPQLGFVRSLEKALIFPPTGTGMSAGSLWIENTDTADPLDCLRVPNPSGREVTRLLATAYAVQAGRKVREGAPAFASAVVQTGAATGEGLVEVANDYVVQPLDATGRAVMAGYETGIQKAGEIGGTIIYKSGQVVAETAEKTGELLDATQDFLADTAGLIGPDHLRVGPGTVPFLRLRLQRTSGSNLRQRGPALMSTTQSPHAWMTMRVPPEAAFLAFDFTVTGAPDEDRIVCAINEQNVFNLPAKYAPDGVPSSTDLIDVSAFAGQDIELFFGLVGGTSTDCEVAVDGIRFITVPQPKVGVVANGSNVAVKWPAAATGWTLESSETLAPESWQPVAMTEVIVEDGVATLEQPRNAGRKFFRLRQNP